MQSLLLYLMKSHREGSFSMRKVQLSGEHSPTCKLLFAMSQYIDLVMFEKGAWLEHASCAKTINFQFGCLTLALPINFNATFIEIK